MLCTFIPYIDYNKRTTLLNDIQYLRVDGNNIASIENILPCRNSTFPTPIILLRLEKQPSRARLSTGTRDWNICTSPKYDHRHAGGNKIRLVRGLRKVSWEKLAKLALITFAPTS